MKQKFKRILIFWNTIRFTPAIIVLIHHKNLWIVREDIKAWLKNIPTASHTKLVPAFVHFMTKNPEFRNVFYHRVGGVWKRILTISCFAPRMSTLFINTRDIGEGFFIGHGFATIIAAKKIGKNCSIYQQVTIGYKNLQQVTIGDNVKIYPGATVVGGITIGDNVELGTNVSIAKDVRANSVIVPAEAEYVVFEGEKIPRTPLGVIKEKMLQMY